MHTKHRVFSHPGVLHLGMKSICFETKIFTTGVNSEMIFSLSEAEEELTRTFLSSEFEPQGAWCHPATALLSSNWLWFGYAVCLILN